MTVAQEIKKNHISCLKKSRARIGYSKGRSSQGVLVGERRSAVLCMRTRGTLQLWKRVLTPAAAQTSLEGTEPGRKGQTLTASGPGGMDS